MIIVIKGVKAEMRIGDAGFAEMDVARDGAERKEDAEQTEDGVGNGAEDGEAQRRAVAEQPEIPAHRHVVIQADGRDGNDRQDRRGDAGRDHPGRERTVHEPLHSGPAREERVSPEADRRQVVAVNRPADHFRDHVISGAEPDRAEPEEEKIIREPPGHGGLHHALDRHDEQASPASRRRPTGTRGRRRADTIA